MNNMAVSVSSIMLLSLFLASQGAIQVAEQRFKDKVIHVKNYLTPSDESCCCCDLETICCHSLSAANSLLVRCGTTENVTIVIGENVFLADVFSVSNSSSIRVIGRVIGTKLVSITCNSSISAGFKIDNVHNFSFSNLAVINCTSTVTFDFYISRHAMIVMSSTGVLLNNVMFYGCEPTALVLLNNNGTITISNATFRDNIVSHNHFLSNNSFPGALNIEQTERSHAKYSVTNSIFDNHYSQGKGTRNRNTKDKVSLRGLGYGGAVFIVLGGNTFSNTVNITFCNFTRNVAVRGGAITAYHEGRTKNNVLYFEHLNFTNNVANITGGGLNVGYYGGRSHHSNITISKCTFSGNHAKIGAGLSIFSTYSYCNVSGNYIAICHCAWENNIGSLSSAVDITPLSKGFVHNGYLPIVDFTNCSFINNRIISTSHYHGDSRRLVTDHANSGIFFVSRFKIIFRQHSYFLSNYFTAVVLTSGLIEFAKGSEVTFHNNIGYDGGAIAMYAFSALMFNGPCHVKFSRNHANNLGGAIFHKTVDQLEFLRSSNCFFKVGTEEKGNSSAAVMIFDSNTAALGGQAIYSESYMACYFKCNEDAHNYVYPESNMFDCIADIKFINHNGRPPLMSSPKQFHFKDDTKYTFEAIPGDTIRLNFSATDDFNQTVQPLMSVTNFGHSTKNVTVKNSYILNDQITPLGDELANGNFSLSVLGMRKIYFLFEVKLLPCPPGFCINSGMCKCAAGKRGYRYVIDCNYDKFTANIKERVWAGYIPANEVGKYKFLFFAPCAESFCDITDFSLPQNGNELNKHVCSKNRKGILCGQCMKNHSSYYNDRHYTCGVNTHCHLGPLFYFLSDIVPMVLFFLLVVTFDLSFTSGISVGFIFFAQYLEQLTFHINTLFTDLRTPYRMFYGIFNFEFFKIDYFSFCLWKDAQILDIIAFKYVTIMLAFCLVLLLIVLLQNNKCNRLCHLRNVVSAKTSVVHGISAFLVICYTQCTKTSFHILKLVQPEGYNGSFGHFYSYYGGLHYLHSQHLYYAIPAIISTVLVTISMPLILFLYPLTLHILSMCGLSEHWIVNMILSLTFINKLKPFIDCFQSCYTDRLRFFAGLFFFYKLLILFCFTFYSADFQLASGIVLALITGIHSAVQPFKKRLYNVTNSLILLNLTLINASVIVSKTLMDSSDEPDKITSNRIFILVNTVQLILLYLPMIAALCIIAIKSFLSCIKTKGSRNEANIQDYEDDRSNSLQSVFDDSSDQQLYQQCSKDYGSFYD